MSMEFIRGQKMANVPHGELIVKDGTITIPSIFMFTGGSNELFPFLYGCKTMNCKVLFKNENITVSPGDDNEQDVILSIYMMIARNPKIVDEYNRYQSNIEKMNWK